MKYSLCRFSSDKPAFYFELSVDCIDKPMVTNEIFIQVNKKQGAKADL
jgi:hypothetical protein